MTDDELLDQLAIHAPPAPEQWPDADIYDGRRRGAMRQRTDPCDLATWPYFYARLVVNDRNNRRDADRAQKMRAEHRQRAPVAPGSGS